MRITTKARYVWSDYQSKYVLTYDKSINWKGPVALCKGASQQQNDLAASQAAYYDTLQKDQSAQFADQQNVLSTLQNTLNPIVQAGPNQYGFNAAETNNLNSNVINNTAAQYSQAASSLGRQQGAAGGGNSLLPSGVQSQQQAQLAAAAASQASTGITGVQEAGYQQGNNQYNNAIGQLGGVAGQYGTGSNSLAGSANSAGSDAFSSATTDYQEDQAASPLSVIGGLVGGAASAFGSSLTGGLGAGLSSKILGCWVAAELYGGWFEPRTVLVRNWIFNHKSLPVRLGARAYLAVGPRLAQHIKTHPTARKTCQKVFDRILKKAEEENHAR